MKWFPSRRLQRASIHASIAGLVLAIAPAAFVAPAGAAKSHFNTNPYTTGCAKSAYTLSSKAVSGGTARIMVSKACGTNWIDYRGKAQKSSKAGKDAKTGKWTRTEVDKLKHAVSMQSYAPGKTKYTAYVKIGSTTTTATCTNKCTWKVTKPKPKPKAQNTSTKVDTFVKKTRGKTLSNVQGGYRGQCVSLVSQYLKQVWGIKPGAWGHAVAYRSGGTGGKQLASRGFKWSTSRSFKNGDILVWGPSSSGGFTQYGHIGIWHNGKVYDQNNGWRAAPRTANYSPYKSGGYLGRWRK